MRDPTNDGGYHSLLLRCFMLLGGGEVSSRGRVNKKGGGDGEEGGNKRKGKAVKRLCVARYVCNVVCAMLRVRTVH